MAQRIPKDFINLLISRANIVDIIGSHLNLQKKGNDYWACCPFHNEKTASFKVDENKGLFYCFGCHEKGDTITFVMKNENLDFLKSLLLRSYFEWRSSSLRSSRSLALSRYFHRLFFLKKLF